MELRHPWLTESEDAVLGSLTLAEAGERLMVVHRARRNSVKTQVFWVSVDRSSPGWSEFEGLSVIRR